jgi:rifampicin phosphotransferase
MLVIPLHALTDEQAPLAGGKGANLGRLLRLGLPVPPGFVVTTDAYRVIIAANELDGAPPARRRERLSSATIPDQIGAAIAGQYRQMGSPAVAVRSSGTAEDLAAASFAGQHDTFLDVTGEEALLKAVRACWASLWSDRAVEYRRQQRIDDGAIAIAVVVQRMVAAEYAGVLFTADPITGERDRMVVEAVTGLGEALVSGQASGHRSVVDKRTLRTLVGDAFLPGPALHAVARLGRRIEAAFQGPQDIEWAWAGGQVSVLQARPMTALPEPLRAGRLERLTAGLFAELAPSRPYPFDQTAWAMAAFGAVSPLFKLIGLSVPPWDRLFAEEDGVAVRRRQQLGIRPTRRILLMPLRLLRLSRRYDPRRWQADPLIAEAESRARTLEARDVQALSWDGLLATIHEGQAIPALAGEIRRRYLPRTLLAMPFLRLLLGLLRQADRFGVLLSGVETKTLEANRALEAMAAQVRSDPALAAAFAEHDADELGTALETLPAGARFLEAFRNFLDRYGHRESAIILVSQPAWKDAPTVVLGLLQGMALTAPRPQAGRKAWTSARDELLRRPILRLPPIRRRFLALLMTARAFPQIREDTHMLATLPMPAIRRTALELGRRLTEAGVLATPEEVFHLKLAELAALGGEWPLSPGRSADLQALVRRRKERRASLAGVPMVDPRLFSQPGGEDALLRGTPGSPGMAEGPVRIIRDGAEFGRLRTGEVLVAPYTNPAWTPLFQRAAAVVVDSGSAASHAAIVAREYGIPAVMATGNATQVLRDGQRVLVDGTHGWVLAR